MSEPRQKLDQARKRVASDVTMLALVTDAFGGYGGIAQYNRDFLSAAAHSGLIRSTTVMPRIAPEDVNSLPTELVQLKAVKARLAFALRAIAFAMRTRPTIIFNGHIYHSLLSAVIARLIGAKLISQLHGTEIWEPLPNKIRAALERSDLLLTVSRHTRAQALAQLNIAPEKVVVVNNTFRPFYCPSDRNAARRRINLGAETAILTVSRLDARDGYKGHDKVIQQLRPLLAKGYQPVYLIAGIGPDQKRLATLADSLGVSAYVRFLGKVDNDALPDLYRAADLFALPSTGEGFGITFIEAMACGTPAIGIAAGGAVDALADGELGVCVSEQEFPDALESAILKCRQRSKHLPKEVVRRFGPAKFAQAVAAQLAVSIC